MGIICDADNQYTGPTNIDPTVPYAPAITTEGNEVQQAYAAMVYADARHAQHLENMAAVQNPSHPRYNEFTQAGIVKRLKEFKDTPAAQVIPRHMEAVSGYVADTEARERQVRDSLRAGAGVAEQLQAQRTWARTKGKLDAAEAGAVTAAARQALESASRADVVVLAEELPDYLAGRQVPSGFVDDVLGEIIPELGEAREAVRKAQREQAALRHDANKLANQFDKGWRSEVKLLDAIRVQAGDRYRASDA